MTIHLGSGSTFGELRLGRMSGQPGVGHFRLLLEIHAQIREQPQPKRVEFTDFSGQLLLHGAAGELFLVAKLTPMDLPFSMESYENSNTRTFMMDAELDRQRIEGIEGVRVGRGLEWLVGIRGRARQEGQTYSVGGMENLHMVKGEWVEILNQCDYMRTLLIEVPIIRTRNKDLAKSLKHLGSAHAALSQGDSRTAVALCRDALESLSHATGNDDRNISFEGSSSFTKAQRMQVLRKALRLLPHAAKHSEPADQAIEWERADAEMLIAMVASLIRRQVLA